MSAAEQQLSNLLKQALVDFSEGEIQRYLGYSDDLLEAYREAKKAGALSLQTRKDLYALAVHHATLGDEAIEKFCRLFFN